MSASDTRLPDVPVEDLPALPGERLPALPAEIEAAIDGMPQPVNASTQLAIFRTRLAGYRTQMASYRTSLAKHRTSLANLRSHLANERTHLSYMRTSVSLIGFGITINRFGLYLLQNDRAPGQGLLLRDTGNAGLGMVVLGLALMIWSMYRFWRVSRDIEQGRYVSRYRATIIASLGLLVLGGLTALWLFVSGPS